MVRKTIDLLSLDLALSNDPCCCLSFYKPSAATFWLFPDVLHARIKGLWAHATSFLLFRNKILHVNTRRKINLYPTHYNYFESNFATSGRDDGCMTSRTDVLMCPRTFQMNWCGNGIYSFVFLDFIQRNVF